MVFAKRMFFFVMVNILIISTMSIVLSFLNIEPYISNYGLNLESLMIYCLIWGFGGAFISLALSRILAKTMMGVQVIDARTNDANARKLLERVHRLAKTAGLSTMPEVGYYESPDVNAFATGPTRNRSLVAVSTGLLRSMNDDEVDGVLAHEVAHIANGDMVTMTLVQGVMNALVMFLARVLAYIITSNMKGDSRHTTQHVLIFVLQIPLSILAMFVTAWVSRAREYRADSGGAKLGGAKKMIAALENLKRHYGRGLVEPNDNQEAIATLKISNSGGKLMRLLSTHPDLDDRIARLKKSAMLA